MALTDLLLQAELLFQNISLYLNNIIIALVIILFGFILGKIVESILRRVFVHFSVDEHLTRIFHAKRNYARAIRRTIVRLVYFVTVVIALLRLHMLQEVFIVLVVIGIFIVLVSGVLAGLEIIPNLTARATLRKKIAIGNEVTIVHPSGIIHGTVVDMTFLDVRVKRKNGEMFFIPNATFLRDALIKRR